MTASSLSQRTDAVPARGGGVMLREIVLIALCAILLRLAFFLLLRAGHQETLEQWAQRGDGESYIRYARAISGERSSLTEYDRRVFPGYPLLIAVVHRTGAPLAVAAVAIDWISAGLVAALAAALFRDRRVGWACVMLIPQYFINSTMAMSEAPMLALTLGGLVLAKRACAAGAGMTLGLAALVRPMACFAAIGQLTCDALRRRWRAVAFLAASSALILAGGAVLLHRWQGDAFRGVRIYATAHNTYNGRPFGWPFQSLIDDSFSGGVASGRLVYVWTQVMVTLAACTVLVIQSMRTWRRLDWRDALALPWLTGNTLFVLCVDSYWGFQHFPRFTIPAMPAMFWALRGVLPRRWYWWAALLAGIPLVMAPVAMREFVVPR